MNFNWIRHINISAKIKLIYPNKNKNEIIKNILNDLNNNFKNKYKKNNCIFLETTSKKIYKINNNILENVLNNIPYSNDEIIFNINTKDIIIPNYIYNKFININNNKLKEIINIFIKNCNLIKRNKEFVYLNNKLFDVILVIDYNNNFLEDIYDENLNTIENNSLIINNDKIIKKNQSVDNFDRKNIFLKQINLLKSYTYNEKNFIKDIKNNLIELNIIENLENAFQLTTTNNKYIISNYNITNIMTCDDIPLITNKKVLNKEKNINLDNLFDMEINPNFLTNYSIEKLYNNYIKAKEYLNSLGLSIKVITKFILDNNLKELFQFLIDDMIFYGQILYDDYINNIMIIKTSRFYYYIKNNIILDLRLANKKSIENCEISFKTLKENIKNQILDLDIKDKVRNYICYEDIQNLKLNKHIIERYKQRISKKDIYVKEKDIKNDIYKNGEVFIGTYYLNTTLIKGQKYIYVLNNEELISIWKINDFINDLNYNYLKKLSIEGE